MHVPGMRTRCPRSRLLGVASVPDWELFVNAYGYASIRPAAGAVVHGALWVISPRDEAALDVYEDIASGLYGKIRIDLVTATHAHKDVLTYVATNTHPGRPRAGYMRLVQDSARDLDLPEDYRAFLRSWGER